METAIKLQAKELRVGNLVQDAIGLVEIGLNGWIKYADIYESIPLTEEWLFKFGFYETSNDDFIGGLYTRKKPDRFLINKETMSYCQLDYEGSIDDIVKIKYVHQLQNIYFALTNEELI
jgi:hypothetical protein